jgi:apolipoprotein D and lipocalin family protein
LTEFELNTAIREVDVSRTKSLVALLIASTILAACASQQQAAPPPTVARVDLERYLGTWFEIARIPHPFQRQCVSDTSAQYGRNPDGTVSVLNRCRTQDGSFSEARGLARVTDPATNARLEVSFFSILGWRPVWGDYWVLMLDENYQYAVVGAPDRRYGWILSRTPLLSAATREVINARLRALGYDPARFEESAHTSPR